MSLMCVSTDYRFAKQVIHVFVRWVVTAGDLRAEITAAAVSRNALSEDVLTELDDAHLTQYNIAQEYVKSEGLLYSGAAPLDFGTKLGNGDTSVEITGEYYYVTK
jgi:hypothetical protein